MNINDLSIQYFSDIEVAGCADTENNMVAWLWFNCPANLREEVVAKIESLRKTGVLWTSNGTSWQPHRGHSLDDRTGGHGPSHRDENHEKI